MKVPWPITVVAVVATFGLFTILAIMSAGQVVPIDAAPSWEDFMLAHATYVLVPTLVVGLIAWMVERNIRRSRVGE